MPSTITSYTTFVAGTKARASQVNANFSNHRGTLVPINEDTTTAGNGTHDLGSSEHQWRRAYLTTPPFINGSQVGKVRVGDWYDGAVPPDVVDPIANLQRTAFPKLVDTDVRFNFTVPDEYAPGNRISLNFQGYCETAPAFRMETVAALYRDSLTAADAASPTDVLTSTADYTAPTTAGLFISKTTLRLTDSSGRINGVTVLAGHHLSVNLKRKGSSSSDTMSGFFFLTDLVVDLNN